MLILPVTVWVVMAVTAGLGVLVLVALIRGQQVGTAIWYASIVTEISMLALLLISIWRLADADPRMSAPIFLSYVVGMLLLLPVAVFWAIAERTSRWGMAVLLIAVAGLLVMDGRLLQLWAGHP